MSVTRVDLDDVALAETMRLSGARTKQDAVNLALRECASRGSRADSLERFAALAKGWDYESWHRQRPADATS